MKVKKELLRELLNEYVMSGAEFAREMGVDAEEVEKMLNGEAVGVKTAKKLIAYLGADEAGRLVDWEAIGKKNPLIVPVRKKRGNNDNEGGDDYDD